MNKNELTFKLAQAGVRSDVYCLDGGLPSEAYCLNRTPEGWEVYYSERGVKTDLRLFDKEEDACSYLYRLLMPVWFYCS